MKGLAARVLVLSLASASTLTLFTCLSASVSRDATKNKTLIQAGLGIGEIQLGDQKNRALKILPPKTGIDQEISTDNCGREYVWLDSESNPQGNLSVRFDGSVVSQIESGTPRFHTREGVRAYDAPDNVRRHYRNLRTYVLLGNSSMAFGGEPLIYWIDWEKGIAFLFASTRTDHQRYLYSVIVFKPNGKFCPERETTDSPNWRELAPYSLEAPTQRAKTSMKTIGIC